MVPDKFILKHPSQTEDLLFLSDCFLLYTPTRVLHSFVASYSTFTRELFNFPSECGAPIFCQPNSIFHMLLTHPKSYLHKAWLVNQFWQSSYNYTITFKIQTILQNNHMSRNLLGYLSWHMSGHLSRHLFIRNTTVYISLNSTCCKGTQWIKTYLLHTTPPYHIVFLYWYCPIIL